MAAVFTWTSYVDTDLAFSEFFNSAHTLTLRYLTPCSKGYEGLCIAENGQGSFALGQGPYFIPPDDSDEPGSPRLYIARDSGKLDIFVVRTDGTVSTAAWDRNVANGAWRGWWSVAEGQAATTAPVTAVSRHPNKLDVFVVGNSGGVYTAAWELGVANGAWRGWLRVKDLVAFPASAVAAVARDPDRLDIFAVRNDGQMCTAAWGQHVADGAWKGWWRIGG